jgi:hypothetical protein
VHRAMHSSSQVCREKADLENAFGHLRHAFGAMREELKHWREKELQASSASLPRHARTDIPVSHYSERIRNERREVNRRIPTSLFLSNAKRKSPAR